MARVEINTSTWSRDSHDLYDFESKEVRLSSNVITANDSPMMCVREDTVVSLVPANPREEGSPKQEALVKLTKKENELIIENPPHGADGRPRRLWLVVKDQPQGQSTLAENDVVKLGRHRLRVKQICLEGDASALRLDSHGTECRLVDAAASATGDADEACCRFCWSELTVEDPGLAPCKCSGTMPYVHLSCLKGWFQSKRDQNTSARSARIESQHCEVCTEQLPTVAVDKHGQRHGLVELPDIQAPFVVLENSLGGKRGYYIASLADGKPLKLGRGHESDLRISDVSISRVHATLRVNDDGQVVLEDNNSKFGTLVQLKRSRNLRADGGKATISLQAGRTVLELCVSPQQAASVQESWQPEGE